MRLRPTIASAALILFAVAIATAVEAKPVNMLTALVEVYAVGVSAGALMMKPSEAPLGLASLVVRLVVGLLVATVAFLLSLRLHLPWYVGPLLVVAAAAVRYRRRAFLVSLLFPWPSWAGVLTGAIAAVLMAPMVISSILMAPGPYPPVFFNVDTPYFLEKVHALTISDSYPPPSLSFADGRLAYHFGAQALAALIARSSHIAPHHALFVIVLPLLSIGVIAAAVTAADKMAPRLPVFLSVPLLLVSIPTDPLWNSVGRQLLEAVGSAPLAHLRTLADNFELWGVSSNNGQNIAAHFLTLMAVAGVASAATQGWTLPVVLIGTAMLFKSPTALALTSGFLLAQTIQAAMDRRARPFMPALAATALFLLTYLAFWVFAAPADYRTVPFVGLFVRYLLSHGGFAGAVVDLGWLVLPALVVWAATRPQPRMASSQERAVAGYEHLWVLGFVLGPLIVVNIARAVPLRPFANVDDNWVQAVLPVPVLLHMLVIGFASSRWAALRHKARWLVGALIVLTVAPPAAVSARYADILLTHPVDGHEFVDNRMMADALGRISTSGTVIVTNDLRYPAEGFIRDDRQMQIPALFGHQAFAVNYYYEAYSFSDERHALQQLLSAPVWTPAIDRAAADHGWTHLLIRKDHVFPQPIRLPLVFENRDYAAYRFSP